MLLRYFSIAFSLIAGLFTAGVAAVLLLSGSTNFRFEMLPFWKGGATLYWLLAIGLLGVIAALLAFLRKIKALLIVFTLLFLGLMVYGFFISNAYRFSGAAEAKGLAWLTFAAVGAFFGSIIPTGDDKRRRA
jgi:hypothetical protein